MAYGKLNLITPPENLFNFSPGYLLVKPSPKMKMDVRTFFSEIDEDINLYIFDEDDTDITWLLTQSKLCDYLIIDVDHCDEITKQFLSLMLLHPRSYYITNDNYSPLHLISRNRINHISDILHRVNESDDFDIDDDDEY